jgi:hypothetical protein
MARTWSIAAGSTANRERGGNGTLNTHWRIGYRGSTASTSSAALFVMRRAPQEPVLQPAALQVGLELLFHVERKTAVALGAGQFMHRRRELAWSAAVATLLERRDAQDLRHRMPSL